MTLTYISLKNQSADYVVLRDASDNLNLASQALKLRILRNYTITVCGYFRKKQATN